MLEKQLNQIQARKKEMRRLIDKDGADLKSLETELDILNAKEEEIRNKIKLAEEMFSYAEEIEDRNSYRYNNGYGNTMKGSTFAKELQEKRSAIMSTSTVIPKFYSDYIAPKFNEVSGILDLVNCLPFERGNSVTIPYSKGSKVGNITSEGESYDDTGGEFSSVDIKGIKITAYTQFSEEVEKLPVARYEAFITEEISKSIKRKIIEQIVNGNGSSQFLGLYNTDVADTSSDIEIDRIDCTTLNKIVYGHNTDAEEVEGNMVLFLNKKDLGEFANVQGADGHKIYDIQFGENGMTGYINGTKFCICNSLRDFSTSSPSEYSMVYLDPSKYTVATFGQIDLKKDYSSGFRNGLVAVKGSIVVGGAITSPYCITRVKKNN